MRLAWRLLEAAHALHCRGVCHLDLSVENVCVGRSPPPPGEPARLTLIDWDQSANFLQLSDTNDARWLPITASSLWMTWLPV